MFKLTIIIILIFYISQINGDINENILKISTSNNIFAQQLFQLLAKKSGNFVISPISVEIIMGLTSLGANNTTAEEIYSVLSLPNSFNEIKDGFRELIPELKSNDLKVIFKSANKIYSTKSVSLKSQFKNVATDNFQSDIEQINFSDRNRAADTINNWVAAQTNNKIPNLIEASQLDERTVLLLINAVYFLGEWKTQFQKLPNLLTFHVSDKETVRVHQMTVTNNFHYYKDIELEAVELPYGFHEAYSFIVVLPKRGSLKTPQLHTILHRMNNERVKVVMPKFKLIHSIDLKDILEQLGMRRAFSEADADFSNMVDVKSGVFISQVVQKAFIDVNENGTEAAAATAVHAQLRTFEVRPRQLPIEFVVDRPFVFILYHKTTQTFLFVGRVENPNNN